MRFIVAAFAASVLVPFTAFASADVDAAMKGNAEYATFYKLMVDTGVAQEMTDGARYTLFVPTEEAFSKVSREKYPCLYSDQCLEEAAAIIRNHIFPGLVNIEDEVRGQAGIYSSGGHFIRIAHPPRDGYYINGKQVIGEKHYANLTVYTVDGLIVRPEELEAVKDLRYTEETTTKESTIPDPACGEKGCPDSSSQTTIIKRIVVEPANTDKK